jgi:hypothetical protein
LGDDARAPNQRTIKLNREIGRAHV